MGDRAWPRHLPQLVGLMGGEMGVESQEGKGSTSLYVPLARGIVGDSLAHATGEPLLVTGSSRRLRILLAEDNEINQQFSSRCWKSGATM